MTPNPILRLTLVLLGLSGIGCASMRAVERPEAKAPGTQAELDPDEARRLSIEKALSQYSD